MIILQLVFLMFAVAYALSQSCTSPVSYYSTDFTIRGPCPNDTVLAAVGSTVYYRCDHEDRSGSNYPPYWHIAGLSGTPFIAGEGSEHDITVTSTIAATGYTTVSIVVQEQYLNNTINIQCGLCSGPVCYGNGDRLIENITSTSVKLVAFGAPANLSTSAIIEGGIVRLSWSSPAVSVDYIENVEFEYEVKLLDMNKLSAVETFLTTDSFMSLSRLNTTNTTNQCKEYYWTVAAKISNNRSKPANGSASFLLQTEPMIDSGSVSYKIVNCSDAITLVAQLSVSTLQPVDTLDYVLSLNDSVELIFFNEENMTITTFNDSVTIEVPLTITLTLTTIDMGDIFLSITINNECGENTTEVYQLNTDDIWTCPAILPSSSYIPLMTTYSHHLQSDSDTFRSMLHTASSSDVHPTLLAIEPQSSSTVYIIVGASVGVFVLLVVLIITITLIVLLALHYKRRKSKSVFLVDSTRNSSENNSNNSGGVYRQQQLVADYLTPYEANGARDEYKGQQGADPETAQYCEPKELTIKRSSHHSFTQVSTLTRETGGDMEVQDTPGYSEPSKCIIRTAKKASLKSNGNKPPTYEDVKDVKEDYKRALESDMAVPTTTITTNTANATTTTDTNPDDDDANKTATQLMKAVDYTYADINEIRERKSMNNQNYAQLEELPLPQDSTFIPHPTTVYSTVIEANEKDDSSTN